MPLKPHIQLFTTHANSTRSARIARVRRRLRNLPDAHCFASRAGGVLDHRFCGVSQVPRPGDQTGQTEGSGVFQK